MLLFTHAATLFAMWLPAKGFSRNSFGPMFRKSAADVLSDYGFSNADQARLLDEGPDELTRSGDRAVLGSMVDYAKMFQFAIQDEGGLAHFDSRRLNDIANECPMSRLGGKHPAGYLRRALESGVAV